MHLLRWLARGDLLGADILWERRAVCAWRQRARGALHGCVAGASDRARGAAQARRGALQTLRGDSANIEQVETLSHTGSVASDGSSRRRGAVAAKVPPFAPSPQTPHPPLPGARGDQCAPLGLAAPVADRLRGARLCAPTGCAVGIRGGRQRAPCGLH